jgi:glucose/arabinose dehydrogenase
MRLRRLAVAVVVLSSLSITPARAADPVTVADGLTFPAGIAFDSGGTMYVNEREGRVLAFDRQRRARVIATIPTITQGETGLLGLTISPDEEFLYAFATEADQTNTIWRVPVDGGEPERVVTGLPGSSYHNGGGVAFGEDGMLYVSNGERHDTSIAQDPQSLGGKVYRYTPDGRVPEDNPFGDSPAFSIGLRNPFGLAIDPVSGNPFVTENGPESHDEINRIVSGGNSGWPIVSGASDGGDVSQLEGDYQDPLLDYPDIIVPTGIAFADPDTAIASVSGDLFFGTFGDQTIHRVQLNEARTDAVGDTEWFRAGEPIVALAWGPRGLYYSTPGAVRVFDLVQEQEREPAASEDPVAAPVGQPADRDPPIGWLLLGGAALILVGALAYAFGRNRKGRA